MADRPQHDDGMRSDPPPSEPVASGTMPDGDGGGAAARGTARGVVEVPRVERGSEDGVVRVALPPELRGIGLAHHHAAGGHQPGHQQGVLDRRRVPDVGCRAVGGHVPGGVLEILDRHRDAGQGPRVVTGRHSGVHGVRRRPGPLLVNGHEGIDRPVVVGDLGQRMVHQLARGDPTRSDLTGQIDHRFVAKVHATDGTGRASQPQPRLEAPAGRPVRPRFDNGSARQTSCGHERSRRRRTGDRSPAPPSTTSPMRCLVGRTSGPATPSTSGPNGTRVGPGPASPRGSSGSATVPGSRC